MKKILIFCILFVGCDTSTNLTSTEKLWLDIVSDTSWSYDTQSITFDSSGKTITIQDGKNYNYAFSTNSTSGVYTTMIEFPPTEWYLFVVSGDELIQYGGFLESNQISQDEDYKTIFTKD